MVNILKWVERQTHTLKLTLKFSFPLQGNKQKRSKKESSLNSISSFFLFLSTSRSLPHVHNKERKEKKTMSLPLSLSPISLSPSLSLKIVPFPSISVPLSLSLKIECHFLTYTSHKQARDLTIHFSPFHLSLQLLPPLINCLNKTQKSYQRIHHQHHQKPSYKQLHNQTKPREEGKRREEWSFFQHNLIYPSKLAHQTPNPHQVGVEEIIKRRI